MGAVEEIRQLEERLRQAELGPDPGFFEEYLADDAVVDGEAQKTRIIEAHRPQPGQGPKFTKVEMSDFAFVDHQTAVIVTCQGVFDGPGAHQMLRFLRVWLKKPDGWRIVAASTVQR
jgi:hypothetical protein